MTDVLRPSTHKREYERLCQVLHEERLALARAETEVARLQDGLWQRERLLVWALNYIGIDWEQSYPDEPPAVTEARALLISGGDPNAVRPPVSLAESQAGLTGPSGSPISPPERDPWAAIEQIREALTYAAGAPVTGSYRYVQALAALGLLTDLANTAEEMEQAVSAQLGTMNFYFGPGARTAVSIDSVKAYERIRDARNATRDLLVRVRTGQTP